MSESYKIKLTDWITFGISCLAVIAKFAKEIIELIPTKGE